MQLENARNAGFDPDRLQRAFALLDGWTEDGTIPGAGAIVTRDGEIVGETYAGRADVTSGRRADADTIWSLASVTKPFTAAAVMLLVEEGKLSLGEPLTRLLPEFGDAPANEFSRDAVTLRHVLSHSSGLPGFSADNTALRRA